MPVSYIDAGWLTDNREPQCLLWNNAVFIRNFIDLWKQQWHNVIQCI